METAQFALSVVAPLFLMIALGYLLRVLHVWNEPSLKAINAAVFKVFLPVLVFLNVSRTGFSINFNRDLTLFCVISLIILFLFLSLLIPLVEKNPKRRGVMIQGAFRGNFVLLGIPIAQAAFGSQGAGVASLLVAFVIPCFNVLSVVTLEVNRGGKIRPLGVLWGILKNPLIIACALGVLFLFLPFQMPAIVTGVLEDLAALATPLALLALGGLFQFSKVKNGLRQLAFVVFLKLVLIPVLFIGAALLFGFRGAELIAVVAVFAAPTAVSSFPMAQEQGGDGELAGQIVLFTTAFSILTLFGILFVLRYFAFL